jgi:hypothetical protein
MRIRTAAGGRIIEGYVAGWHLEPVTITPSTVSTSLPAISSAPGPHLSEDRRDVTRSRDGGRAHPLGEADRPRRNGLTPEERSLTLIDIVRYLDVENPRHLRYRPQGRTTFCNIYAYDYACLAGVYLPRIWWTPAALALVMAGQTIPVRYDDTVRELNANMLHDWFVDWGPGLGWQREIHLDVLQAAANRGEVCIIVARRRDLNRSGHITAVVPENDGFKAVRSQAGTVLRPLESQAGAKNHNFVAKSKSWWLDPRFQSHGFWRHA